MGAGAGLAVTREPRAGVQWPLEPADESAPWPIAQYTLLLPPLEAVPHEQRTSAIVKGAGGLPARPDTYRRWWRGGARAAGIPDGVWNMTPAGGATEADEAGAALEAIQGALTHERPITTLAYLRRGRSKRIDEVAAARRKNREGTGP